MQKAPVFGALEVMTEVQMTCAAAFVEGGVQDACDDSCSICLENFSENDPATRSECIVVEKCFNMRRVPSDLLYARPEITVCKHEYHLQCILEWSQRSKECPMCWQPLCFKDQDSQLLLAASEQEKALRHERSSPFHQYSTRDMEFHRFGSSFTEDADLEDRIMHHLAAAAMGRAQQLSRRGESLRIRPSPGQGHSHCTMVPVDSNASSSHLSSTMVSAAGNLFLRSSSSNGDVDSSGVGRAQLAPPLSTSGTLVSEPLGGGRILDSGSTEAYSLRRQVLVDPVQSQQGTSSSDLSLSESLKSRLVAASSRYRESLTRSTRSFRDRLRARNGTIAELGTRAREVSAGVVRALERMSLESPDNHRDSTSAPNSSPDEDLRVGPVLVQSGLSHVPEWMEGTKCSPNSFGDTEHTGDGTASSSTNALHHGGLASRHKLAMSPSDGEGNDDGSSCSHDHQRPPVSPLAV